MEKILLSQKLTKDQTALLEATKKNRLQISPLNPKNINMKSISNHQHDLLRNNQQLKRYEKFIEQERKILSNHYDTNLNYATTLSIDKLHSFWERWSHIAYGLQGIISRAQERRDMRRTTSKARLDIFDKRLKELTHSRKRTEQTFFENLDANIQKIKDYYRDRIDQLAQQNENGWLTLIEFEPPLKPTHEIEIRLSKILQNTS